MKIFIYIKTNPINLKGTKTEREESKKEKVQKEGTN